MDIGSIVAHRPILEKCPLKRISIISIKVESNSWGIRELALICRSDYRGITIFTLIVR